MLSFLSVEARRVDVEKAEKIARSYARVTPQLSSRSDFRLSKTVSKRIARKHTEQSVAPQQQQQSPQQQDEPIFYVFAANGNRGFIIVSGDDVAKPVLGYSDDGTYDENNPNLAYWMETLSQEIAYAIENGVAQNKQIEEEWNTLEYEQPVGASGDYVDPLVKTKWDQNSPYNNLCPSNSATGCVATAMAQIMKYHEHPTTRTVEIPGYTTGSYTLPAITGTTDYDWEHMLDIYSSSSTNQEDEAVATLMYHCGVSVEMNYGPESGAYSSDVVIALRTYFGYDAALFQHHRDYYSYSEWINLLKTEIRTNNRPVYYSGHGTAGGHAFVCDGYDINDLFHFNWGWGGSSDGYFEVSALNPGSIGIGGGAGGFNQGQAIIVGIQPDNGGQATTSKKLGLSTITVSPTTLSNLSQSFSVTVAPLENIGTEYIGSAYLGVLLRNQDNSYNSHQTSQKSLDMPAGSSYYSYTLIGGYTLPSSLSAGTYKLYPACSFTSSQEVPSIISGPNGVDRYISVVVANNGSVTLSDGTAKPDLSLISLQTAGNIYQNRAGDFETEIANNGAADYNAELSVKLGTQTITEPVVIPAGTTKNFVFTATVSLSPGEYSLSVWYDPANAGSPSEQLGDAVPVEVKATPTAPSLSLVSYSFLNGSNAVPVNAPNLTVEIQNTGGLFNENVNVYVFPQNGGSSIGSFGAVNVRIDNNETQSILFNNPLDFLEIGTQYRAYVYYYSGGWQQLGSMFYFTVAESYYSSDATLKSLIVKDANTQAPLTLTPDFSPEIQTYSALAENGTTTVSIIGEANHHRARFTNIENEVLDEETNTFNFEVTAEDGITKLTYTVTIMAGSISAQMPDITAHPQSATCTVGRPAAPLSVTANVTDGGTLSYQWYVNTNNTNIGGTAIAGATSDSYMPSTDAVGTKYYYVKVTNTNDDENITGLHVVAKVSNPATIRVIPTVDAQTPNITAHPQSAVYIIDATATALSITANVTDGGTLSYQWYSNTDNTDTGGTAIANATSDSYMPSTATLGTVYYYVQVTNTNDDESVTGSPTTSITSNVAAITVNLPVHAQTPVITTQPQSQNYTVGTPATILSVMATITDGGTLSYQWYRNTVEDNTGGTAIPNATSRRYTPSTTSAGTAYYYAVITNTNTKPGITGFQTASTASDVATITVTVPDNVQAPEIATQPQSDTCAVSDTVTLSVVIRIKDGGTLSYQWYSNTSNSNVGGTEIPDAISASYTPPTGVAGITYYYVVITNTNPHATGTQSASITSDAVAVVVLVHAQTPTITVQPQSVVCLVDSAATALSVTANVTDGGILSYQWYSNTNNDNTGGTAIADSISASYTPSTAAPGTTYYYAVITNTNTGESITGSQIVSITSNAVAVTVNLPVHAQTPVIVPIQPDSVICLVDSTAKAISAEASVTDGGTLSYQWYSNTSNSNVGGIEINDATLASYTPSTAALGTTYYYVKVTNTNTGESITGLQIVSTTSNAVAITVNLPVHAQTPVIVPIQPDSVIYLADSTATAISVEASVDDGGTLLYQWYSNTVDSNTGGAAIKGAASASYTPSTATVGTTYYYVVVTNKNTDASITGYQTVSIASDAVAVTVNLPVHAQTPDITAHPQPATYTEGKPATVSVEASVDDGGTLSYQWYSNTSNSIAGSLAIDDAVSASYMPSTAALGTTYYFVVITNTNTDASITGYQTVSITSEVAAITIIPPVDAQTPDIATQPQPAVCIYDSTATALSVEASVTDGGTLSYQWYSNTNNSNDGGVAIAGAVSASYTPSTAALGTTYYFVVITNTNTDASITGLQTVSTTSDVAAVTVNKASQSAPDAPALANKGATSVTLNTISGNVEYSIDGVNWQDSPIFDGLAMNTAYTFYARMKDSDTHHASSASEGLSVTTYAGTEADLESLTVNGEQLTVAGMNLNYQAECGETEVSLGIDQSNAAAVTITVNGDEHNDASVPLSGDSTVININIVSDDKLKTNDYRLTVMNTLNANTVLFQRWDDVIAVNRNSANSTEYESVRWYRNGSDDVWSSAWFIPITGNASDYRAEIKIADKWRHVCGNPQVNPRKVTVYPNPVSIGENLTLQLPDSFTGGYMNVISLTGSIVKQKLPLPGIISTVNVADWAPGIYLLNIVAPNGDRETVKIAVSN
jgi:hypothetical protein